MSPWQPDFYILDSAGTRTHAVEIKYYAGDSLNPRLLIEGVMRLRWICQERKIERGLFVVSVIVPDEFRATLEQTQGIAILDRRDLLALASKRAEMVVEMKNVLDVSISEDGRRAEQVLHHIEESDVERGGTIPPTTAQEPRNYCKELRELAAGRDTWSEYETLCEEVLKYLFEDDLVGWYRQIRTEDGLNRYDLVCRIANESSSVWRFLAGELGSRYVLFEFKNHSEMVDPGSIYSTERYLLEHGKRTVGFLLSRHGLSNGAKRAVEGAMRENGKLIVSLSDDDICDLLAKRTALDDISEDLFRRVDDFLIKLPR